MPKKIDPELRARAVRLARDHQQEEASPTRRWLRLKQLGLARESVRRWVPAAGGQPGQRGPCDAHARLFRRAARQGCAPPSPRGTRTPDMSRKFVWGQVRFLIS